MRGNNLETKFSLFSLSVNIELMSAPNFRMCSNKNISGTSSLKFWIVGAVYHKGKKQASILIENCPLTKLFIALVGKEMFIY